MMFQLCSMFPLLVVILEFSALITFTSGLHLQRSQYPDAQSSPLSRRTVYNPKITSPDKTTVWKVGQQVDVTWDLHGIPKESWKQNSKIVLGWIEPGSPNEHLDLDHPLFIGELGDKRAVITVPNVPPRDNYIVVVFGDSGNHSPTFSIRP